LNFIINAKFERAVTEKLLKVKNEFVELLPEEFRKRFAEKCFIGGGAIFSLYNGEEPKDYDFFVTDRLLACDIHRYFDLDSTLRYKNGIKIGVYKGKTLIVTDNAVSFDNRLQIITRWVGTPKEVVGQFDFLHNMFYFQNGKVEALVDWKYLFEKKLYYNEERARDICGTIIRVKKFVERGFTITNKEMSKMLLKLHEVGFNDRELEILNYHDERNDFGS
jgi:hypothetical protein